MLLISSKVELDIHYALIHCIPPILENTIQYKYAKVRTQRVPAASTRSGRRDGLCGAITINVMYK